MNVKTQEMIEMTKEEMSDFVAMSTTAELLDFYNAATGKDTKRFASRSDGQIRLMKLYEETMAADQIDPDVAIEALVEAMTEEGEPELSEMTKEELAVVATTAPIGGKIGSNCVCPSCGAVDDQTPAGAEGTAGEARNFCHRCGTTYNDDGSIYKAPASSASRSLGVSVSWANPEVAAARKARHSVLVDGKVEYRSVLQAFQKLGLPIKEHIRFRMELKAEGNLNAYGRKWEVIAK